MARLILFNKPFEVLCQFTDAEPSERRENHAQQKPQKTQPPQMQKQSRRATLADFISIPNVYAAGRLDFDSEGLVVLTDAAWLQHAIRDPRHKFPKTYFAQVENVPSDEALRQLEKGVRLRDGWTRPARVRRLDDPPREDLWPRVPPIRARKNIPTAWLAITLTEGRNRQVRRMTAAIGHPTLRLIRVAIGPWELGSLRPGEWREMVCPENLEQLLSLF